MFVKQQDVCFNQFFFPFHIRWVTLHRGKFCKMFLGDNCMKVIVWITAICAAALAAGCGGGGSSGPWFPVTLSTISVAPPAPTIASGGTQGFVATGNYSDGTNANISSAVAWTSSNNAVATVASSGVATGVTGGTAVITATLSGKAGSANLTVSPPAGPASVSGVTTDTLTYSKTVHITVNGQNLLGGITLVAPGCSNIALVAGGTTSQVVYTCTPAVSGSMPITVNALGGSALSSISPTVPVPQVTMVTTMGQMVLELYPNNAPITVANFMQYVASGFYSNLIFHRVIPGFVIQGGGFTSSLQQPTTLAPITFEWPNGLSNTLGSVAMARTSALNSATSQFFINLVDNSATFDSSTSGYAVFGAVVSGMSVVDSMAGVPTQTVGSYQNVPVTPIVINSMTQTQ
jgi:peptidyl-prolyl cis-trans isomerase A (cyclophilin A)